MAVASFDALAGNDYPGRGLLLARTAAGGICVVYFMTGRSPASRERVLSRDGPALSVRPRLATSFDPLRHYRAVIAGPDWCVIGNGDHVEAVTAALATRRPAEAVQGIQPEPDPPLRTPRITVIAPRQPGPMLMAGARASTLDPAATHVSTVSVDHLAPGCGLLTTTYLGQGERVVATNQLPAEVTIAATGPRALLASVWSALPAHLRVAAAVIEPHAPDPLRTPPLA